jgi:hypothetical protein
VWEGRCREAPPYPDFALRHRRGPHGTPNSNSKGTSFLGRHTGAEIAQPARSVVGGWHFGYGAPATRFAATVAGDHATLATKRALPLTWAGLPPAGSHQLAWRTHSITSSALSRIDCGTVRPSALAVLRFTTNSNFVGSWTGSSVGFAPRRMRSTEVAARRKVSTESTP